MQQNAQTPALSWPYLSLLGIAQICGWGTLFYAFPQIAVGMEAELGWTKAKLYGALTLSMLCSAVATVPMGILIDRGYGRAVMTTGSILAGGLLLVWSQVNSLVAFYTAMASLGAVQAAVLYNAIFAVVAKHFVGENVRSYITTLTLWGGFASTVFIPAIEVLMGFVDWRQTLMVLAAVNLTVCAGIYAFLPTGEGPDRDEAATPQRQTATWALVQPIFWVLLICFLLYALMTTSFRFHLYPLLIERGWTGEDAVFILALLGPAQVAGRAVMKLFQTKSIASVGILIAAMFPLVFLAMILFPASYPILVLVALIYGAAAGTMTIVKGLAVPEFMTKSSYGLINGMMNTPISVLSAFGPTLAALSWSISGSYDVLLITLLVMSVVMLLSFAIAAAVSKGKKIQ